MIINIFKNLAVFVILCLAQVLVFNQIHLFNCATPLLYVYFIVAFQRNTEKWALLLWGFSIGIVMDSFSNTPGIASASMTFLALIQQPILNLFIPEESDEDLKPSFKTMGKQYVLYVLLCVLIYTMLFFTLELFNFFNFAQWIECVCGSSVLTIILILALDNVSNKK
jgi:rod shape-determining protein MreD